jgi:hypothetical protein
MENVLWDEEYLDLIKFFEDGISEENLKILVSLDEGPVYKYGDLVVKIYIREFDISPLIREAKVELLVNKYKNPNIVKTIGYYESKPFDLPFHRKDLLLLGDEICSRNRIR